MLNRLALRNVKGQWGSYLLYFLTVAFTVSMLFAVENLLYSKELMDIASMLSDISQIINFSVVLVSIVSAIVLGYTSAFMVKLRSREFGLYLTLGMRRGDIMRLFATETAIISLVAIAMGFGFGILVYQGLMGILLKIMGSSYSFSFISIKGSVLSIVTALFIFLVSSLFSLRYLGKATISSLLSPPKSEKTTKHIYFWSTVLIISFGAMVGLFFNTYSELEKSLSGENGGGNVLLMLAFCLIVCFVFHFVLSRVLFALLSGNRRLMGKGSNSVVIKNLQSRSTSNALLMGTLSVLFLISVGASSIAVTEKAINDMDIDKSVPYSVMAFSQNKGKSFFSKVEEITEEYSEVKSSYSYSIYTTGKCEVSRVIKGAKESGWMDYYMALSDFNALLEGFGRKRVELEEGEYIASSRYREYISNVEFPETELDGKTYRCIQSSFSYPDFLNKAVVYIVPDIALSGMEEVIECKVFSCDSVPFDILGFKDQLYGVKEKGDIVWSRDAAKYESDSTAGVLIIAMLFISTVSISLSLAILSVKTLSSVNEDKRNMSILRSLGVDGSGRRRIVGTETLVFFLLPLSVPLVLSIPISFICAMVYRSWGMSDMIGSAYITTLLIDAFIIIISILYYFITLRIKLMAIDGSERVQ